MGTVSEKLKETGDLAATFFFSSLAGLSDRRSKRRFVTTLAYQLLRHPALKRRISARILTAVEQEPAVFGMDLKEQLETLILHPLRDSLGHGIHNGEPPLPKVIVIDGLDECDLDRSRHYPLPRTKEDDQEEVLSAFPFRIVIASRPEVSIRRFFKDHAANDVAEIFLNNEYNPDRDIALFLKSKFAELRRQHTHLPAAWPSMQHIDKLVSNASGQFIYAATVIRFIATPTNPPQVQLDIILQLRPQDKTNPFGPLDALYTSILMSSPCPSDAVLWLHGYGTILRRCRVDVIRPSSWSHAGQAQIVLGLPSLIYTTNIQGPEDRVDPPTSISPVTYAFYHKSFLDFLGDHRRSKQLPEFDSKQVDGWVCDRFGAVLKYNGPEVPLSPDRKGDLDQYFRAQFLHLWSDYFWLPKTRPWWLPRSKVAHILNPHPPKIDPRLPSVGVSQHLLAECDPSPWMGIPGGAAEYLRCDLFVLVHRDCRLYRPCDPVCKQWRKALLEVPNEMGSQPWLGRVLDRFCILRFPKRTYREYIGSSGIDWRLKRYAVGSM
ncbi:hypothetical protein FA13DRAFT_1736005 [Coprinellus micaceus]|uniref:Nephrocystin 3-like N-terminal domain-containing protein n=1 Tax=Coprinellus micaceus TaxID=71717 RepID=A0A4Y7T2D2_COPMI|nr:hypothetical protein FA13DRAFT_1736005 [Coprinellus micaceus]